jgi:hypothetical protein
MDANLGRAQNRGVVPTQTDRRPEIRLLLIHLENCERIGGCGSIGRGVVEFRPARQIRSVSEKS